MPTLTIDSGARPTEAAERAGSQRNLYLALFGVGLAMRLALMFWKRTYIGTWDPSQPFSFGMEEGSVAEHLARGLGFSSPLGTETGPTAWLAPVYPIFVALVFKLFGIYTMTSRIVILSVNATFGAATSVVIHRLATRTLGTRVAFLSAWAWAAFPIFYRWGISWVWEFALSAFLLTVLLLATVELTESGTRRRWLIFGALWGVAALTNPALLSLLPVTGLYAAFQLHRKGSRWFVSAALSAVLFFAMITPLAIRNYNVFHKFVFLRGNFWFEFYLGNYHLSNGYGFRGKHPTANPRELARFQQLGEAGYIDWAKQQSVSFLRQYPREFGELTLKRTFNFWSGGMLLYQANEWWEPWEYWPLSAMALLGMLLMLTRRPRGWALLVATMMVYPIPYYLTYPVAKYRHALEPVLVIAAAFLVVICWDEVRARRLTPHST